MKKLPFVFAIAFVAILFSFSIAKKAPKKIGDFVRIEGGEESFLSSNSDSVATFYIQKYEVTNAQYNEFLNDTSVKLLPNYNQFLIDTAGWVSNIFYNGLFVEQYHKHPAFDNYPVVNVRRVGVEAYCNWLENKVKDYYKEKFGVKIEVRLPSKTEWVRAARGGFQLSKYPWGGNLIFDSKNRARCAFREIRANDVVYNYETKEYVIFNARPDEVVGPYDEVRVVSFDYYEPNSFGLYNMSGNAAEMIQTPGIAMGGSWNSPGGNITVESEMPYETSSREVGFRPVIVFKEN